MFLFKSVELLEAVFASFYNVYASLVTIQEAASIKKYRKSIQHYEHSCFQLVCMCNTVYHSPYN